MTTALTTSGRSAHHPRGGWRLVRQTSVVAAVIVASSVLSASPPAAAAGLDDVAVQSAEYDEARARLDLTVRTVADAQAAKATSAAELVNLDLAEQRLTARIGELRTAQEQARQVFEQARSDMENLLVAEFTAGGRSPGQAGILYRPFDLEQERRDVVVGAVQRNEQGIYSDAVATYNAVTAELGRDIDDLNGVRVRRDQVHLALNEADRVEREGTNQLDDLRAKVIASRRTALVVGADFPFVALEAYYRAANRMADEAPECGVDWSLLAGIARIESGHGTSRGSRLTESGSTSVRIIGIQLDGTRNTARISDTDGGELDGDAVYDRAVGPMQFIPSTWARHGRDGNGDGVADPHNLFDAALAAASYLCKAAGTVTGDNVRRALLSYNRSDVYGTRVIESANRYAAAVPL